MKNDLMKKVGELLDLAGLDKEVIKSVTEKLADEDVVLEGEKEMQEEEKVKESPCSVKHEEEDDQDEKKAPVDPKTNEGGYNAVTEEEFQQIMADFQTLKEEYAKLVAERAIEEAAEEEASEENEAEEPAELEEALVTLLSLVKEAYEQTSAMKSDFEALKEEYAKLVAERVIEEGCAEDDEVAVAAEEKKGEEEDKAENAKEDEKKKESEAQEDEEKADLDKEEGKEKEAEKEEEKAEKHKKEEKKDKAEEDKDFEEAHKDREKTAEKIAESVEEISEEAPAKVTIAKAYSAFTAISESAPVKEEKKAHKAFTLFPNL